MIKYIIRFPFLKKLIPSFYKRYFLLTNNYFKDTIIEGIKYNLDLRHLIDRRFFFHKTYEEELFLPLKKIIDENQIDYFFDIGSCWGLYSLRLSKTFKHLNILSFEPIKKNVLRLKHSIKINKIKNIKVLHTALGYKKGFIKLSSTETYSPNYKINETNCTISEKSMINSLDNLINISKKCIILKIDTEEFELEVIKGSFKLLKSNKCYVQVEVSSRNKKAILTIFKKLSYKLISVNRVNKTDYLFSNFITKKIYI